MNKINQKGFTLIELLIVIGIIAILAAAVIIAINPGRQFEQARNATRWSHMNSVANAVYSYAIDNGGNFPACEATAAGGLEDNEVTPGAWGTAIDISECEDDLVDTYMAALPTDPQTAGDNGYMISTDGTRIKIEPDPAAGDTTDDIVVTQ